MKFEWDTQKAENNLRKHGISFNEAATVFGDCLSMSFPDPDHSVREERYITIGLSSMERILIVSHTDTGEFIRIISAREATRKERKFYEKVN